MTCATKLVEGAVRMDAGAGLTEELRREGYVLPCVSRARGDIKLEGNRTRLLVGVDSCP
jgi:hypothetical protein